MTKKCFVSLILPTFKEAENLPHIIPLLGKYLPKPYEIIIVDDNSQDGTDKIANKLKKKYSVRYICRKNQKGLATAVVEGFNNSNGKILGVIDADLSHPVELIPVLINKIKNGYDIAIGSRFAKGGGVVDFPLSRKLISIFGIKLVRLLTNVIDPLSGFFFLKKEVIKNIKFNPIGYKILLEVLVKGDYKKVCEIPFIFKKRFKGESKLNIFIQVEYLIHVLRLYLYKIKTICQKYI